MANSTVNNTPDGFDDAVTALREITSRNGDPGQLVHVTLSHDDEVGWLVSAQSVYAFDERERIDVLRAWARALNGGLELSEEHVNDYGTRKHCWRQLAAKGTVSGTAVEIWAHIDHHDIIITVVEAPELVAAHA